MTKENLIPKTETVYKIRDEKEYRVPSFEEFMKNYENDENLENSYNSELESYGNLGEGEGYGPCSYSTYEIDGRNINKCGSLDCSYYRRIVGNRVAGTTTAAAGILSGVGFWTALAAAPFTSGASLAIATGLSAAASVSAVGGTALGVAVTTEALNEVERDLRRKWERKQTLQNELNKLERELREAIEKKDRCKRDSDYRREQEKIRELESKIENIKRDLRDC